MNKRRYSQSRGQSVVDVFSRFVVYLLKVFVGGVVFSIIFTALWFIVAELFTAGEYEQSFWHITRNVFIFSVIFDLVVGFFKKTGEL